MNQPTPEQIQAALLEQAKLLASQGGLTGGGAYFRLGKYKLTLVKSKIQTGHKGYSEIFEFRVDAATKTGGEDPNGVGSTVSCVYKPNDPGDLGTMSRKNRLAMAAAFAGVSDAEFLTEQGQLRTVQMYAALIHPTNPCRGMAIDAEGYAGSNKKGDSKVYVKFTHDPDSKNAEEIARRRQAIDAGG